VPNVTKPQRPAAQAVAKPTGAGLATAVGRGAARGTGLVRSATRGIERVAEIGEEVNRDSGGRDEMGHYHFNVPVRTLGSASHDYGTREGALKRNSQQSHTLQAAYHRNAATSAQAAGNQRSALAHSQAYHAHSQAWRNPSPGNSAHAWGMTHRAGDSGTSEGAKKAAATRAGGSVRTGGNYGVDIKAGVNTKQVQKRPDPEPFRGYDSRRK
jgi:hypothetical protein